MKKRFFILPAFLSVLIVGTVGVVAATTGPVGFPDLFHRIKEVSQDKTVVATVNGEPIYRAAVRNQKASEELSCKQALAQGSMRQKQQERAMQTEEDLLSELIRKEVILQEATRQGLLADNKKVYTEQKEIYEALKAATKEGTASSYDLLNYQFVCDYREALNLSEEEYLQQAANAYCLTLTRANLFAQFKQEYLADHPNAQPDDEEIRQAFDAYVDTLVEAADIQYKNPVE